MFKTAEKQKVGVKGEADRGPARRCRHSSNQSLCSQEVYVLVGLGVRLGGCCIEGKKIKAVYHDKFREVF